MADTKISAMTAATAATASTIPVVQGGVNKKLSMTGAGASMIEAADAAAQRALLTCPGLAVANIFSVNGAASTPALSLTGTPFAGGSGTTTKPLFLVEPTGTISTGWNTSIGTALGINLPSLNTPLALDIQVAGGSAFSISPNDTLVAASAVSLFFNGTRVTWYNNFFGPRNSDATLGSSLGYWAGLGLTSGAAIKFNDDAGFVRTAAAALKVTDGGAGYGQIDASAYKAGGTAGIDFSGAITNITVVKGIVTAAS